MGIWIRTAGTSSLPKFSAFEARTICSSTTSLPRSTLNSSDARPHSRFSQDSSSGSRPSTYTACTVRIHLDRVTLAHTRPVSPETNLHLPSLRAVYAIPGNASCADVDFVAEHDCTPPTPSHPDYIPTRAERDHYQRLCAWAGLKPEDEPAPSIRSRSLAEIEGSGMSPEKLERAVRLERQLERYIGLPPPPKAKSQTRSQPEARARKTKTKGKARGKPVPSGPPLRFVLIDQIVWDEDLPHGTLPPPPMPSKLAYSLASDDGHTTRSRSRTSTRKESASPSRQLGATSGPSRLSVSPSRKPNVPQVLPPLPSLSSSISVVQPAERPKRFSRPRSGGGAAQGLVQSPKRLLVTSHPLQLNEGTRLGMDEPRPRLIMGGYRVAKTVKEAEAIWAERDRKERERLKEEKRMRERGGFDDS